MTICFERSSFRPGLILMAGLFATLLASPSNAHEVHEDEPAATLEFSPTDNVQELVRSFRETGDDHYLDEAWTLVEPALADDTMDAGVLIDAATVAQSKHEFEFALDLTRRALASNRNNDQAWLLLASIHLVRGEGDRALDACSQLRRTSLLIIITCRARAALANDETERERVVLDRLLARVDPSAFNTEGLAWSLSVAGDLAAAAAEDDLAIAYYKQSLRLAESTQVRAALVDVLLENGRLDAASDVLDAGAPALPLVVRRLIIVKRQGNEADVAEEIRRVDHEFSHWVRHGDWLHAREMARFYLDVLERPELARRLAIVNLEQQREPEDLRLAARTSG